MSFVSTFNSVSKNGWSNAGTGLEYSVLATSASNLANAYGEQIQMAYDGSKYIGVDGTVFFIGPGIGCRVYEYVVNSNNTITVSTILTGNLALRGASELAYSKQSKDTIIIGAPGADVGNTNTGTAQIISSKLPSVVTFYGNYFSERLGSEVFCNSDGNIIGICNGPLGNYGATSAAYIYTISNSALTLRDTITPYDGFVASTMDDSGNIIITADPATFSLKVYNYNSNTGWTNSTYPVSNTSNLTSFFGRECTVNGNGDTAVVMNVDAYNPDNTQGRIFIFKKSGNTWIEHSQIDCPQLGNTYPSYIISNPIIIDQSGNTLGFNVTIDTPGSGGSNNVNYSTVIYNNINNVYTLTQTINAQTYQSNFLINVNINGSGSRIGGVQANYSYTSGISNVRAICFSK